LIDNRQIFINSLYEVRCLNQAYLMTQQFNSQRK